MLITLHPVVLSITPQIRMNGGPRFKNTFLEDAQGDPQSQIYWDTARWEWALRFVGEDELMAIAHGFFLARKGGGYAWLFLDPLDQTDSDLGGVGRVEAAPDGKRYLFKVYADTDNYAPYKRRIRCPIPGTVVFSGVGGSPVVNPYTGEVTGATSDGNATFEFLNPVIFTSDFAEFEREPGDAGSMWGISIREVGKFQVAT